MANKNESTSPLQKAIEAGKLVEAFELAKEQWKANQTPESLAEFKRVFLLHAHDLARRNAVREGFVLLNEASAIPPNKDLVWLSNLAECQALFGNFNVMERLLASQPDTSIRTAVMKKLADHAMIQVMEGGQTRGFTPTVHQDLLVGMNLIKQAFSEYESGHDEKAKNTLQGIGMTSPFLDWKLLIRGFIAYSTKEDQRAIENWSRLDPAGVPAKYVGAFRAEIDKSFLEAQTAKTVEILTDTRKRFADGGQLKEKMLQVHESIEKGTSPNAFRDLLRIVSPLVKDMKAKNPKLFEHLRYYLYWSIVKCGSLRDLDALTKLIGRFDDDIEGHRVNAMIHESMRKYEGANQSWMRYLQWLGRKAANWPAALLARAKARILYRMAMNANMHKSFTQSKHPLAMLAMRMGAVINSKPMKPSDEELLEQAIQIAPDWPEPVKRLIDCYMNAEQHPKAEALIESAMARFPDNLELVMLAIDVYQVTGNLAKMAMANRKALAINPLDRDLQVAVAEILVQEAIERIHAKDYEQPKAQFQETLTLTREAPLAHVALGGLKVLCMRNKEDFPANLVERFARSENRPALRYAVLAEAERVKLPLKQRKILKEAYEEVSTPIESMTHLHELGVVLLFYQQKAVTYRGHAKYVKAYEKLIDARWKTLTSHEELSTLCFMLLHLRNATLLGKIAVASQWKFPDIFWFPYYELHSILLGKAKPSKQRQKRAIKLFGDVLDLIEDFPNPDIRESIHQELDFLRERFPWLDRGDERAGPFYAFDAFMDDDDDEYEE